MKVREYENFVAQNAKVNIKDLNYSFVGLAGEVGEVLEWHKKVNLRKEISKLTREDLKSELGDVLHYLTRISLISGWNLKELMEANVQKLKERDEKNA